MWVLTAKINKEATVDLPTENQPRPILKFCQNAQWTAPLRFPRRDGRKTYIEH